LDTVGRSVGNGGSSFRGVRWRRSDANTGQRAHPSADGPADRDIRRAVVCRAIGSRAIGGRNVDSRSLDSPVGRTPVGHRARERRSAFGRALFDLYHHGW